MWNEEVEQFLRELITKSQLWSLLHADSQRYYNRLTLWLKIPQVILNSLSTSSTAVSLATENNLILIFTIVFQLISTVLSAVTLFLRVAELAAEHGKSEAVASSLSEEIAVQLALPEQDRVDAKQFIAKARSILETVRNKPAVVDSIVARYSKFYDSQQPQQQQSNPVMAPVNRPVTAEFFGDNIPESKSSAHLDRLEQQVPLSRLHQFQLQRLNTLLQRSPAPPASTKQ